MNEKRPDSQAGGISVGDVYFVLFRQKWIILTFSLLGIIGAVVLLFVIKPPQYQSTALLSIRYVVEGKSLNPPGSQSNSRPLDEQTVNIINTEIAALNSLDLAKQVVDVITPEKILAASGEKRVAATNRADRAAFLIRNGLTVEPIPESSVIRITFQYPDPALVQPILSEFINAYKEHMQSHQGLGVSNEFLTNEIARLSAQLTQTDDEISKIKSKTGVVSIQGTQKAYADQISKIRQDILNYEVELSGYQAVADKLTASSGTVHNATNVESETKVPDDQIAKYRHVCILLASLEAKEQNYLTSQGFTTENMLVRQVHAQIDQYEAVKKDLENKYPQLAMLSISPSSSIVPQLGDGSIDLRTASEQVAALKAKIKALNSQYDQVWVEATNFDKIRTTLVELEQKRDGEAADLKYFRSNLEESRLAQEDRAANISIFQKPSPPVKGWSKSFKKKVAMLALGSIFGGVALAFFIELFLDRSIKRPSEVETKLRLPLFVSIPDMAKNGHQHVTSGGDFLLLQDAGENRPEIAGKGKPNSPVGAGSESHRHPLRRFYEGLRDRLVVYFEVKNLTHKPKFVGVTSCARGAGVSSIAAGLAASLSETGEGNVLLVDMNVEGGAAQHFHKGKLNCGLEAASEIGTRKATQAKENLYVAAEPVNDDEFPLVLFQRFAGLVSKIRSSDYDYIIFDMPPVAETTVTFRAARHMDMMLLVIEAGKTNQEVIKRVMALLAESKANVSTVLNKTRNYVPPRLHQEFLHDV